jgi:hypothetical protein
MCNGQLFPELIFRLGGSMLFSLLKKVKLKGMGGQACSCVSGLPRMCENCSVLISKKKLYIKGASLFEFGGMVVSL